MQHNLFNFGTWFEISDFFSVCAQISAVRRIFIKITFRLLQFAFRQMPKVSTENSKNECGDYNWKVKFWELRESCTNAISTPIVYLNDTLVPNGFPCITVCIISCAIAISMRSYESDTHGFVKRNRKFVSIMEYQCSLETSNKCK